MDAPVTAPPVVAVMVTCDPGPWLEEALAALGAQDYPNLSVLVLDAASASDPTPRVAAVLPSAFVRRLQSNPGFGAAANEVLHVVEGASHYLFCHDDAAPDPDAVRLLVEEAFRSNAGIVSPKMVDWDDSARLLQVGMTADKTGTSVPLVERGELDQEQHDGVRDVFVAPGGATLVRADLFSSLGGYDPAITLYGEDVDLSWRAQIVGARVVVAPAARVRHVEALSRGLRPASADPSVSQAGLRARHALLAMRKAYGPWHLLRVGPQAVLATIIQAGVALASGRRRVALELVEAWRWNLARRGAARPNRRALQRARVLDDAEVRRLQVRGTAGVSVFARGRHPVGDDPTPLVEAASRGLAAVRVGLPVLVALGVGLILLLGTRGLLGGGLSAVGELAPFPRSPFTFLRLFAGGWRVAGLGADGATPPAFALLGSAGVVLAGAMGLLQRLVVLGLVPLGLIGTYRLTRPLGSSRAAAAAVLVAAAIPLPYNAIATGSWSGLVSFALAPWAIGLVARASGAAPYGGRDDGRPGPAWLEGVLSAGLVLALATAIAPAAALAVLVAVGAMVVARVAGGPRLRRGLPVLLGGIALALALLLPWSLDLFLTRAPAVRGPGWGQLLRFETGPLGAAPLGWVFLVAAALPLVVGRGWRLSWATAAWFGALGCWSLAWVVGRGWLPVPVTSVEALIAPASICLALAVALGVRAFELDLPDYHFGWRQLSSAVAAGAVALGLLPVLGAAFDGRWSQPRQDQAQALSWMRTDGRGDFRVLWIGEARNLPLPGWRWRRGLAYAASRGGTPDATSLWPGAATGATPRLATALSAAADRRTTQLGRLLAPMGVRYLVVPARPSPARRATRSQSTAWAEQVLAGQLDLGRIDTEASLTVYENASWVPLRAALPAGQVPAGGGLGQAARGPLEDARPVLTRPAGALRHQGPVADNAEVLVAEGPSARWQLTVAGERAPRRAAFDVANVYEVRDGGPATLRYRTSAVRYGVLAVQLLAWGAVAGFLVRRRWPFRRHR